MNYKWIRLVLLFGGFVLATWVAGMVSSWGQIKPGVRPELALVLWVVFGFSASITALVVSIQVRAGWFIVQSLALVLAFLACWLGPAFYEVVNQDWSGL